MLSKDHTIAGARVVVVNPKDGLPSFMPGEDHSLDGIRVWQGATTITNTPLEVPKDGILEITRKPRKSGGINMASVKIIGGDNDGEEGDVYWCELRVSCNHLPKAAAE